MLFLTFKTRIFPTKTQKEVLWDLAEKCRLLYNFALAERKIIWDQERKIPKTQRVYINYTDQQNALPSLKERYPEYKWVYSKVLQSVLRTLDANFKSFFALWKKGATNARPPKFKGKRRFYPLKYNQSGFRLKGNILSFSHRHPSKTSLTFSLPYIPKGRLKQTELYYDHILHCWFVSFNCQVECPAYSDNGLYQSFDTGIKNIVSAVNSQGKFLQIPNRRPEQYWRKKIAEVQAKRGHCKKYSPKWYWYNKKLIKMGYKLKNQLRDWQHKISKVIVTNTKANTLIFGKPSVKEMVRKSIRKRKKTSQFKTNSKTLHYALQNTGSMSRFTQLVAYKATKVGKRVILINEAYTSQICPTCGAMKPKPLSQRIIVCNNCGLQLDRDLAAAINILASFYLQKLKYSNLLNEPSVNEESFLLKWKGFLRQTVEGKTEVALTTSSLLKFRELVGSSTFLGGSSSHIQKQEAGI